MDVRGVKILAYSVMEMFQSGSDFRTLVFVRLALFFSVHNSFRSDFHFYHFPKETYIVHIRVEGSGPMVSFLNFGYVIIIVKKGVVKFAQSRPSNRFTCPRQ